MMEKIKNDLTEALKSKDEVAVSTLRLLTSAVKNFEIAKKGTSYQASEEEIVSVIWKEVKQRKEAIDQFQAGNRQDLVEKESKELQILEKYLPKQLPEEEITEMIEKVLEETGAVVLADMGKVMSRLSADLKGRADMSTVSKIVREKLSSQ